MQKKPQKNPTPNPFSSRRGRTGRPLPRPAGSRAPGRRGGGGGRQSEPALCGEVSAGSRRARPVTDVLRREEHCPRLSTGDLKRGVGNRVAVCGSLPRRQGRARWIASCPSVVPPAPRPAPHTAPGAGCPHTESQPHRHHTGFFYQQTALAAFGAPSALGRTPSSATSAAILFTDAPSSGRPRPDQRLVWGVVIMAAPAASPRGGQGWPPLAPVGIASFFGGAFLTFLRLRGFAALPFCSFPVLQLELRVLQNVNRAQDFFSGFARGKANVMKSPRRRFPSPLPPGELRGIRCNLLKHC